jgi:hypothetical protein
MHIGFEGQSEAERWPEDVRPLVSQNQHEINKGKSERWGFSPNDLDPLMEERQRARKTKAKTRARQEQDLVRAQQIDSYIENWKSQQERQAPGTPFQRTFYVSTGYEEPDRACLLLGVFLVQAGLIWQKAEGNALRVWAAHYLVAQWQCADLSQAYLVFAACLDKMVGNAHWKASGLYLSRLVKSTRDKSPRDNYDTRKQRTAPYSIPAVIRILEESKGPWVPTRYWLYDQINTGRIPYGLDAKRRKCLDEEGLAKVRKLIEETFTQRQCRKGLMVYQMEKLGKKEEAAKKYIQRRKKKDESFQDMAQALRAGE